MAGSAASPYAGIPSQGVGLSAVPGPLQGPEIWLISRRGHASVDHLEMRSLLAEMSNDITSEKGAEDGQFMPRITGEVER